MLTEGFTLTVTVDDPNTLFTPRSCDDVEADEATGLLCMLPLDGTVTTTIFGVGTPDAEVPLEATTLTTVGFWEVPELLGNTETWLGSVLVLVCDGMMTYFCWDPWMLTLDGVRGIRELAVGPSLPVLPALCNTNWVLRGCNEKKISLKSYHRQYHHDHCHKQDTFLITPGLHLWHMD